jgi:hypothetical protein
MKMNTPVRIFVLDNDTDPDGDALTVAQVSQPSHGQATLNAEGTVTYEEPRRGFKGIDSFTYFIGDGNGGEDTATVTIDVILRSRRGSREHFSSRVASSADSCARARMFSIRRPVGRP